MHVVWPQGLASPLIRYFLTQKLISHLRHKPQTTLPRIPKILAEPLCNLCSLGQGSSPCFSPVASLIRREQHRAVSELATN